MVKSPFNQDRKILELSKNLNAGYGLYLCASTNPHFLYTTHIRIFFSIIKKYVIPLIKKGGNFKRYLVLCYFFYHLYVILKLTVEKNGGQVLKY